MTRFTRGILTILAVVSAQTAFGAFALAAEQDDNDTFKLKKSTTARESEGATPSKLKATKTEAALKLLIIDKDDKPIEGIVICLVSPEGEKYYTEETDAKGYAEVLVPIGKTYEVNYLSLGESDVSKRVTIDNKAFYTVKLTLKYSLIRLTGDSPKQGFVLKGVNFESGSAKLTRDSYARLDSIVEFMKHKKSAKIEISGHTDNVGNARRNQTLSKKRANACRDYLVSKGIQRARIKTVGYGPKRPVAPNETEYGRAQNRRIEAIEL